MSISVYCCLKAAGAIYILVVGHYLKYNIMKITLLFISSLLMLSALKTDETVERLNVKGPLEFNNTKFHLKWSDIPRDGYYIQEYLPKKENLEDFNQMITIHLFDMGVSIDEALRQKIKELEKRKENDPICNYQMIESPDGNEFIIDFLLGENENEEMKLVEFNIYRYKKVKVENGKEAVLVYAYTKRSYDEDIKDFFSTLKSKRQRHLEEMTSIKIPKIKLIEE